MKDDSVGLSDDTCDKCHLSHALCTCKTVVVSKPETEASSSGEVKTSQAIFQINDSEIGKTVAGRYVVKGVIGVGGMGTVYDARHVVLDNRVALKILRSELVEEESIMKRFEQEARACAALKHPNLVSVYDCGMTESGEPFLVMEFLEGPLLLDDILSDGKPDLERFFEIFMQVATGLEFAHDMGVVHRDLKPTNIIITRGPDDTRIPKVVDFGIAKIEDLGGNIQMLTQTGEVFGSPAYMSPEQCQGSAVDGRADIYALGCVMYEALSGKQAFAGHNIMTILEKQLNDMPRSFDQYDLSIEIPERLSAVVMKCLEKAPEDRYQSCGQLKAALRDARDGMIGSHMVQIGSHRIRFESIVAILLVVAIGACLFSFKSLLPTQMIGRLWGEEEAQSRRISKDTDRVISQLVFADYATSNKVYSDSVPVFTANLSRLEKEEGSSKACVALVVKALSAIEHFDQPYKGIQFYEKHRADLVRARKLNAGSKRDQSFGANIALAYQYAGSCYQSREKYFDSQVALQTGLEAGEECGAPDWVMARLHVSYSQLLKVNLNDNARAYQEATRAVQLLLPFAQKGKLEQRLFDLEEAYRWQSYSSWGLGKFVDAERAVRAAIMISVRRRSIDRTRENYENLYAILKAAGKEDLVPAETAKFKRLEKLLGSSAEQ